MKHFYITVISLLSFIAQSQNNTLLNRNFWKKSPTIETIQAEINKGNNPTELNPNGFDPTTLAINEGASNDVIKFLLSIKGNDVNKLTHDKRTYIFWSASKGNIELMQHLVDKGAKTNLLDDKGYSILNFAASTGQTNTKIYDFCIKQGINPKKDVDFNGANGLLLVAPLDKDFSLINYFISKGLDINSVDTNGNTAINYAARTGNIDNIKRLLEKGVKYNDNAMIMASQGGRGTSNSLETYQFLEGLKISPNVIGKNGENVLHNIVRKEKQHEIIEHFISKGVDANKADNDGNTPFMNLVTSNNKDFELINSFSSKIKDINLQNKKGISALALAIRYNTAEVAKFLIEKGADVKVIDSNGDNLAAYLIQSYNPRNEADFNAKLELLTKKGFELSTPQKNKNTLYHLAIAKNDISLLKSISRFNVDINAKNNEGMTALHKAALTARDETILKFLIEAGSKKDLKTDMDETAYDLASENEYLTKNKISIDFLK